MAISKRQILLNCTSGAVESVINVLVVVWLQQYLVKRISAEEYSLYPVVMAFLFFAPLLTTVLTSGVGRYVAEAHARADNERVRGIVSTMTPILLGTSMGILLLGIVLAKNLDGILTLQLDKVADAQLMLLLLMFSLAVRVALSPYSVGLYVCQRFVLLNGLNFGGVLLRAGLLILLLTGLSTKVRWVVVATVTADVAVMVTTLVLSLQQMPSLRFRRASIRWKYADALTVFGIWSTLSLLAYTIRRSSDALILNKLATPQEVTAFSLGTLPDNQVDVLVQKATAPLQVQMVAFHATGQHAGLQEFYLRGGRYSLWAALLVATPMIAFGKDFWRLYLGSSYEAYADAALVTAILMAQYWIIYPNSMLSKLAHAVNQMKPMAIAYLLGSAVNVAITLYLVGSLGMGAVGSAVGTFLSSLLVEPLVVMRLSLPLLRIDLKRWFRETVWYGCLPSIVTAAFCGLAHLFISTPGWWELCLVVLAACTVYLGSLAAFCMNSEELGHARRVFEKVRSWAPALQKSAGGV